MEREAERARKPHLEITGVDMHENTIRVRVINTGGSVAKGSYGRITIEHTKEDVISYPVHPAFITPDSYAKVDGGNLCWAFSKNPAQINIAIGAVPELLQIARLEAIPNYAPGGIRLEDEVFFKIPSEEGWGHIRVDPYRPLAFGISSRSRVLLKARTYTGMLIVGAEDLPPIAREIVLVYQPPKQVFLQLGVDVPTGGLSDKGLPLVASKT
jgi:hypothetical protein